MFRKKKEEDEERPKGQGSPAAGAPPGEGLNREMKRMMKRNEGSADRLRRPAPNARKPRTSPWMFIKEVRGELARVTWPTRQEVVTYSVVVVVTVAFFMVVIAGIDYVALKAVLALIGRGGK